MSIDDGNFVKVMTSEAEQSSRLVIGGYERHGSEWLIKKNAVLTVLLNQPVTLKINKTFIRKKHAIQTVL